MRSPTSRSVGLGLVRGKVGDPLRESHRDPALRVAEAIIPQAPDRAQAILGVVEPLGNRKNVCPRRTNLGTRTFRIEQRRSKCRVQLHLAPRTSANARLRV